MIYVKRVEVLWSLNVFVNYWYIERWKWKKRKNAEWKHFFCKLNIKISSKNEKNNRKNTYFRPFLKKKSKIFSLKHSKLQKKCRKSEKKFCQFGKRLYFCSPVWDGKSEDGDGKRSLRKQRPKAACHLPYAAGRGVVAENEKGNKDNSEEILTMKSLILAQDER